MQGVRSRVAIRVQPPEDVPMPSRRSFLQQIAGRTAVLCASTFGRPQRELTDIARRYAMMAATGSLPWTVSESR